jgi:Haem-dependent oxidative N-demethylase, alpha subunit-like
MGLRQVEEREWLQLDDSWPFEVAHKVECAERFPDLEMVGPDDVEPAAELRNLLKSAAPDWPVSEADLHPLVEAGRNVAPDLCVLEAREVRLLAASLLFANQWTPRAKWGLSLLGIHAPVEGYDTQLANKVGVVLGRLSEQILVRRNWFIHDVDTWCIPERLDYAAEPADPASLTLRSERQVLRRLPDTGAIVFMIRTQQVSLGVAAQDDDFREAMLERLTGLTELDRRVRHLESSRAQAIVCWLDEQG